MTIDRTELVELLIEKTSLSSEEVEMQLEQLIEKILDAAERGKALEIKEFGLFFFDQEGNLKFEPSEELSTEISFKYAGMKPVELKPERNTAIPEDDELSRPISANDDVIVVPSSEQKNTPAKPKATPTPKPKSDAKPISRQPIRKKNDRSAVWALLAFFTVLFIGALIYFNRPMDSVSENSVTVNETESQDLGTTDTPETVGEIEMEIEVNGSVEDQSNDEEQIEEQISDVTVPIQNQMYGLTGAIVDEANNGFSIVIHSFYNELRAEEVAENFRTDGYRVHVTSRVIGDLDVWRVSLGQFETILNAQQAAQTLPEPFNENHFIQRIQ